MPTNPIKTTGSEIYLRIDLELCDIGNLPWKSRSLISFATVDRCHAFQMLYEVEWGLKNLIFVTALVKQMNTKL